MKAPRHWRPLVELQDHQMFRRREIVEETAAHYGITMDEAEAMLDAEAAKCRYYVNDLYQVQTMPGGPGGAVLHICIRRRDGGMFKDWRHFQQIKNEIAGPEREAFELYPAESRKVDTSNKWHLWVLPEGVTMDVGWKQRDVQYEERRDVPGLRQRAL